MTLIKASVGRGGTNQADDVRLVQELLNKRRPAAQKPLLVTGSIDSETIAAIENFQIRVVNVATPDGRIDPDGKTFKALLAGEPPPTPVSPVPSNLSGAAWWHANQSRFP